MFNFINDHIIPGKDLNGNIVPEIKDFNLQVAKISKTQFSKLTYQKVLKQGTAVITYSEHYFGDHRYSFFSKYFSVKTTLIALGAFDAAQNINNLLRFSEDSDKILGNILAETNRIKNENLPDNEKRVAIVTYINTIVNQYNTNDSLKVTLYLWIIKSLKNTKNIDR